MECIEPPKADDVQRLREGSMARLIGPSGHESERWGQRSEFGAGDKGQIDLESAREEKDPVNPGPGLHVKMMQGRMLIVHPLRPVGEDIRYFGGISNAKSEIYVRPLVFLFGCARTSDRGTTNATVMGGVFKKVEAQLSAFFRRKHGVSPNSESVFNSIATSCSTARQSVPKPDRSRRSVYESTWLI